VECLEDVEIETVLLEVVKVAPWTGALVGNGKGKASEDDDKEWR